MKKIFIGLLCFIVINCNSQTQPTLQELIDKSTETLPDNNVQNNFPHFFEVISKAKSSDSYIKHIYFGEFEGKSAIRMVNVKGIVIIDNAYLSKTTADFDALATWFLCTNFGVIHFMKDNPNGSVNTVEGQKSKFYFALGKAKEMAENGYCQVLKVGLNNINGISKSTKDLNIKQATIDIMNDDIYTKSVELSKLKGCPTLSTTYTSSTSNNNVALVTEKSETEKITDAQREIVIKEALSKLDMNVDNVTNKITWHDKRTPFNNLSGEGLHASIRKNGDKYSLLMTTYHIPTANSGASYITKIIVNDGTNPNELKGNLFEPVTTQANDRKTKDNGLYIILKNIVTNNKCTIRFFLAGGRTSDYSLGNREIKEIKTVLDAWETINGL